VDWRGTRRVMRYNGLDHRLELLAVQNASPLQDLVTKCSNLLPDAHGSALILLGSETTVNAAYERPTSLLWRDAGVLLQTFALAATAYRLAFCPLGILGSEIIEAAGLSEQGIQSTGAAIIGRLPKEAR